MEPTGYLVIDCETNGLPNLGLAADDPAQPRIASCAIIATDLDFNVTGEFYKLVRPEGWAFDDASEAAAVNHLTSAALDAEGVSIREVLDQYVFGIDQGNAVVAHNARGEVKMLRGELRRAGIDDRFAKTYGICTMRSSIGVCRIPKRDGHGLKLPTMTEAYAHFYKRPFEFPHTALGDARACLELARYLKRIDCLDSPALFTAKSRTKPSQSTMEV